MEKIEQLIEWALEAADEDDQERVDIIVEDIMKEVEIDSYLHYIHTLNVRVFKLLNKNKN